MQLIVNTNEELSDLDRQILALVAGGEPAAAPAPAAKKAAAAPKPKPTEDLVGGDAPTMSDAVALATKLVSAGQSPKVKAALADAGAKRVSELSEDAIPGFVAALSD